MASKNIKGITVEIGGDTTGLDKALSDVNKQANTLSAEMRQVDNALKNIDPDSTELLAQKQEILSKQIEVATDKLNALNIANKSLEQQFKDGDIDKGEYDKFKKKIEDTEKKLNKLKVQQESIEQQFKDGDIDKEAYDKFQKKIASTENLLKKLQVAEKGIEQQFKDGDIGEEQFREYRREILNTENQLKSFQSQQKDNINAFDSIKSSLSKTNDESKFLEDEIKKVNKALDDIDPKNPELLAQKQEILSKQIEVTSDKLEKLKSVQDQVNEQVKNGKISETTYRGFQREVIATEATLKKLQQQQEDLSKETVTFAEATKNVVKATESAPKNAYEQVQNSLKSSEDYAKSLEDEMQKVNKVLKDVDPKNPELLAQKQEILNSQIKNTTNRLGELKEAQSKVEEQFKNGDIGEQQYREFQREVISTEKELANLSQQQTELEKATDDTADEIDNLNKSTKDAGEAAEDSSSKFEGLGSILKGIGVAVGTAVAAVGVATVKLGKDLVQLGDDYNSAVNDIGVKTGTTGKELEGLGDIAKNVYTHNFGDSLEDVAEGLSIVKQNTGLMGDELEAATEASYKLRDGFDFDMGESSRAAAALMKNMGVSAEEAYNLIAYGAQNGANKNGDLLDTINEYSAQYASLGLSADQFINTLVDGANNGAFSVDKVGDAVKELNLRVKDGSANEAFAELGLVSKDNSEKIEETTNKIADLEQKLKYAERAQSQFNDKTSELTKTKNADSIKSYKEQISELKDSLNDMKSATDSTLPSAEELQAQFAAGGEKAQIAFNQVVAALDKIEDPVEKNKIAVELFGTQFEDLQDTVIPALKNVSTNTKEVGDVLSDIDKIQYNDLNSALEGTSRSIQGVFMDTASEVSSGITDVLSGLGNAINEADGDFDKIAEAIGTALEGALSVVSEQ